MDIIEKLKLSWIIINDGLELPNDHRMNDPSSIMIYSYTRKELNLIKQWCKSNKIFNIKKSKHFNITGSSTHHIIIADKSVIIDLENWLKTIPVRDKFIILDMKITEARKLVKNHNAMIVLDPIYSIISRRSRSGDKCIVNLSDAALHTELSLIYG